MRIFLYYILVLSSFFGFSQDNLDDLLKQYNKNTVPYISVQELAMPKTQERTPRLQEPPSVVLQSRWEHLFEQRFFIREPRGALWIPSHAKEQSRYFYSRVDSIRQLAIQTYRPKDLASRRRPTRGPKRGRIGEEHQISRRWSRAKKVPRTYQIAN